MLLNIFVRLSGIMLAIVLFSSQSFAEDAVGKIPGSFEVTPYGSASYSVPIDVPPGVNGIKSDLALVYDSRSGSGDVGIGWGLSGIDAITRCGTNLEQDPSIGIDGIDFDSNDRFCLNGSRLVLVGGTGSYGSHNSEYKTEVESFKRIVAKGTSGSGPAYFEVYYNSGSVAYFGADENGNISDGRITGFNGIYQWSIKTMKDRFNNTINYSYLPNSHYLDRVTYSNVTVQLNWASRPDVREYYLAHGARKRIDKRLSSIIVESNNNTVWQYSIEYGDFDVEGSHVLSINKCDGSNQCRPSLDLTWDDPATGFTRLWGNMPDAYFTDGINDMGSRLQDINGDGLADMIQLYFAAGSAHYGGNPMRRVMLSNGSGFVYSASYSNSLPDVYFTNGPTDMGTRMGDINGDGLVDLIQLYHAVASGHYGNNSQRRVYLNNGNGFAYSSAFSNTIPDMYFAGNNADMGTRLADINGDGFADLIQLYYPIGSAHYSGIPQRRVFLSNGNQFVRSDSYSNSLPETYFSSHATDMGTRLGDINGDGMLDLIQLYHAVASGHYGNNSQRRVYLNNGNGFEYSSAFSNTIPDMYFAGNNTDMGTRLRDINGDGFADLIQLYYPVGSSHHSGIPQRRVFLSDGGQFVRSDSYSNSLPDTYFRSYSADMGTRLADLNGDGLVDIVQSYHAAGTAHYGGVNQRRIYLNKGTSFEHSQSFSNSLNDTYFTDGNRNMGTNIADVNGDGSHDLVQFYHVSGAGYYGNVDQRRIYSGNLAARHVREFNNHFENISVHSEPISTSSAYTKQSNAVYPMVDNQGPLFVVTSVDRDDGVGGIKTTSYKYWGLKYHHTAATSLDFHVIAATDHQTGLVSSTYYSQNLANRSSGMPILNLTQKDNTVLSATSFHNVNRFSDSATTGIYKPYVKTSSTWKRDISGTFISTSTLERSLDDSGKVIDEHKCISDQAQPSFLFIPVPCSNYSSIDHETHTQNQYYPDYYVTDMPGLLQQRSVTATVPHSLPAFPDGFSQASSETRVTTFDYFTSTGKLKEKIVDPSGDQLKTSYSYHSSGQVKTATVSGQGIATATTTNSYDSQDRLVEVKNSLNHKQYFYYDHPSFSWLVTRQSGPNGISTLWDYNSFGSRYKETRSDGTTTETNFYWCNIFCLSHEVYFSTTTSSGQSDVIKTYDTLGRQIRVMRFGYNGSATGRLITQEVSYNARGLVEWSTLPYYVGDAVFKTHYNTYDLLGRATDITQPDGTNTSSVFDGLSTVTTTSNGAKSQSVTTIRNALGQVDHTIDNAGLTVHFTYDAFGNQVLTEDSAGNLIKMGYDNRGFKVRMVDPDKGFWRYNNDSLGRLVQQTDAKQQQVSMSYDVLGRMITRTDSEGTSSWTYDVGYKALGKLSSVTNHNGYTESYNYDVLGRLVNTSTNIDGSVYSHSNTYDSLGRIDTTVYPTGLAIKNVYHNVTGVVERIQNTTGSEVYWTAGSMTATGQLDAFVYGNNVASILGYYPETNQIGYITSYNPVDGLIVDVEYGYDDLGNLVDSWDGIQRAHDSMTYDDLNRMTSVTTSSSLGTSTVNVQYDDLGNITYKSDVGAYNYSNVHGNCSGTTVRPHAVLRAGAKWFCYDANGNVSRDNERQYTFASFDKPTRIQKSGSNYVEFSYGPNRNRYKRKDYKNGVTTNTVYVGNYEKVTTGGVTKEKHYIGDFAIITKESGLADVINYLHRDNLGSVVAITDANGSLVERMSFDPWGKRRLVNWQPMGDITNFVASITTHGFTDHEHIDSMGLIHMNGRVYDPVIARFISADPFIQERLNSQSYNRYSYIMNNPLSGTDPSGYWSLRKKLKSALKSIRNISLGAVRLARTFLHSPRQAHRDIYQAYLAERRRLWRHKDFQRIASVATYICGPFQPACQAAAGAYTADAYGASPAEAIKAGARSGVTAYITQEAGGRGGNLFEEALIEGTAGGITSKISGGNFNDGFKMGVGARYLRAGIDRLTGFFATWDTAESGATYKPDNSPAAGCQLIDVCDQFANNIGAANIDPARAGSQVTESFGFLDSITIKEGSATSNFLAAIPGFNSGAVAHDRFVGGVQRGLGIEKWEGLPGFARELVTNYATIAPVIATNYVALGIGTVNQNRHNLNKSIRRNLDDR